MRTCAHTRIDVRTCTHTRIDVTPTYICVHYNIIPIYVYCQPMSSLTFEHLYAPTALIYNPHDYIYIVYNIMIPRDGRWYVVMGR